MILLRNLSLASMAAFASVACAQTARPITVVVDGNPVVFPNQQPQMSDARVLVPLRGVFEKLGASVGWDPASQSITARTRSTTVKLTIGQLDASVNNQPVHMDIPATLVAGTTMVPLRFVSEALGAIVGWNPAAQEVDIKSKVDYAFPRGHDHDRRPSPPPHPPLPPPAPPRVDWIDFAPDSVIPFVLVTRLNSGNAQVGDQFVANLYTSGRRDYFGLPNGTVAYGTVSYVRRQHGRDPGVIELAFDHLVLNGGRTLPINGKIVDIHSAGLTQLPNGALVVRGVPRNDHAVFTGYGQGPGLVVAFNSGHMIVDAEIGGQLMRAARPDQRARPASNVELRPGTQIAVRLYSDFRFRRDGR